MHIHLTHDTLALVLNIRAPRAYTASIALAPATFRGGRGHVPDGRRGLDPAPLPARRRRASRGRGGRATPPAGQCPASRGTGGRATPPAGQRPASRRMDGRAMPPAGQRQRQRLRGEASAGRPWSRSGRSTARSRPSCRCHLQTNHSTDTYGYPCRRQIMQ